MDYDNLDLGHPAVSKSTVTLVDLDAYVYGLEEIKGRTKPVSIIVSCEHARGRGVERRPGAALGLAEMACQASLCTASVLDIIHRSLQTRECSS